VGLGRVKPPKWPAAVTEINSTRHSVFRVEKITLPCGRAFYSWGDLRRLRIFFLAAIRWPTWRSISNAAVLRAAEDLAQRQPLPWRRIYRRARHRKRPKRVSAHSGNEVPPCRQKLDRQPRVSSALGLLYLTCPKADILRNAWRAAAVRVAPCPRVVPQVGQR
jgi:hypothetical protein